MENQNKEDIKLIFGLTPKAAIINSAILFFFSGLFWAIYFYKHIPAGVNFLDPVQMKSVKLDIEVPWYIDLPIQIFAMYILFRWLDYKFGFKDTELMTLRVLLYKIIFGIMPMMLFIGIVKITTLITIIKLNQ